MSSFDTKERPNRIPWPPILLVIAIVASYSLASVAQVPFLPPNAASNAARWLGAVIIACAIGLDLWALFLFRRHQTTILPNQGSNQIVTAGPFSVSRNPIYVGNLAIVAGLGLRANSLWFLLALVPMAYLVQRLAIEREEQHLAAKFPQEWANYAARVPRWLGRSKPEPNSGKS
ncbi:MAG: isoprenylcysteine carboxylmethyltransferase family protein [Pseudomonadota bacterium]